MPKNPTILNTQPINKNFLGQLDFKFILKRSPHVNFFLQRVNLPQIVLPNFTPGNPFVKIPYSGDHINFDPLSIEFKVDEDFYNYLEIHDWLYGLGFPQEFQQYADLHQHPKITGESLTSDISLMILSSVKKPNIEIIFADAFPTSLSNLVFSTTPSDVDYLSCLVTFAYTYYIINRM